MLSVGSTRDDDRPLPLGGLEHSRRHHCRRPLRRAEITDTSALPSSFVVFIDASHLSFLLSWMLTDDARPRHNVARPGSRRPTGSAST